MIGKLRGIYDSCGPDWVMVDVGGVGYLVFASSQTLRNLPSQGETISLLIDTHVREEYIHLFGFLTQEERIWFRHLFTVQGVGGKVALSILSSLPLSQLIQAIAAEDKKILAKADGVGPKLALRLATELKEKARNYLGIAGITTKASGDHEYAFVAYETQITSDAVSALLNLGYGRQDAFSSVNRVAQKEPGLSLDQLIKQTLKELSQ